MKAVLYVHAPFTLSILPGVHGCAIKSLLLLDQLDDEDNEAGSAQDVIDLMQSAWGGDTFPNYRKVSEKSRSSSDIWGYFLIYVRAIDVFSDTFMRTGFTSENGPIFKDTNRETAICVRV